jgi:hypothetical protein
MKEKIKDLIRGGMPQVAATEAHEDGLINLLEC